MITKEKVLSIIEEYNKEYKAPASVGDIVFELIPEHVPELKEAYDKIDKFFKSDKGRKLMKEVSSKIEELIIDGKLNVIFGGYVARKKSEVEQII